MLDASFGRMLDVAQDARALRTAPLTLHAVERGRRGVHMRVFFATDIHGSEVCWRKFLNAAAFYKADLVVLGGDVTGKVMVPVVAHNGYWQAVVRGETIRMETRAELEETEKKIRNAGHYPALVSPDELQALSDEEGAGDRRFSAEMSQSL